MGIERRVAVITGSGTGIGKAIAKAFAGKGCWVALCDINEVTLKTAKDELVASGATILAMQANVGIRQQVENMMAQVIEAWGKIDILINNAGGSLDTPRFIEDVREEDWDKVIVTNLKGTFLCCKAVAPIMKKQQYGKIINMSSQVVKGRDEITTGPQYASAKAGISAFTRRLARELGPHGINVNAIAPGYIIIPGSRVDKMLADRLTEAQKEAFLQQIPMRRTGTGEDIAHAALFLASDEASYVNGTTLEVDGGCF